MTVGRWVAEWLAVGPLWFAVKVVFVAALCAVALVSLVAWSGVAEAQTTTTGATTTAAPATTVAATTTTPVPTTTVPATTTTPAPTTTVPATTTTPASTTVPPSTTTTVPAVQLGGDESVVLWWAGGFVALVAGMKAGQLVWSGRS